MNHYHYNFPGLWFQIYKQVLAHNERLKKDRPDKSSLREVVTTIFIASTQKGITSPRPVTKFHEEILRLIENINSPEKQKQIYHVVKTIIGNGKSDVQSKDQREAYSGIISNGKS